MGPTRREWVFCWPPSRRPQIVFDVATTVNATSGAPMPKSVARLTSRQDEVGHSYYDNSTLRFTAALGTLSL